ncbi:hypothetical protein H0X06_01370 [Candidatus Dependentiae bacterium]|nr:hypothetical protein [Candidatus Dependentiae bacterium]
MIQKSLKCYFLIIATGCLGMNLRCDNASFIDAIEKSDVIAVKKLLRKEGIADLSSKNLLLEKAEAVMDTYTAGISLLKSRWDLRAFVAGLGLCGAACFGFTNIGDIELLGKIVRLPILLLGLYVARNAWKCPAAVSSCEDAREIKNAISTTTVHSINA